MKSVLTLTLVQIQIAVITMHVLATIELHNKLFYFIINFELIKLRELNIVFVCNVTILI